MLLYGAEEVYPDTKAAFYWASKAAENQDPQGLYILGVMYQTGQGVQVDKTTAASLFYESAMQGYAEAQYSLGLAYKNGDGVERDLNTAYEWFSLAAQQGHPEAANEI